MKNMFNRVLAPVLVVAGMSIGTGYGAAVADSDNIDTDPDLSGKIDELELKLRGLIDAARRFRLSFSQIGNPQDCKNFTTKAFEQAREALSASNPALASRIFITIAGLVERLRAVHLANMNLYFGTSMAEDFEHDGFDKNKMTIACKSVINPLLIVGDIK